MNLKLIISISVMEVILLSCTVYTRPNIKSSEIKSYEDQHKGYVYGTYSFNNQTYFLDENVALVIGSDMDKKEYYIDMRQDKGYFFFSLEPGTYKISLMQYKNRWTRDVYDVRLMHSTFTIQTDQITYLGSFATVSSYDRTYIHWGISSVADNNAEDADLIKKEYPSVSGINFSNQSLAGTHNIADLLYLPNNIPEDKKNK